MTQSDNNFRRTFLDTLRRQQAALESLHDEALLDAFDEATALMIASLNAGGRLFVAGNGGSACDAQHFAAEFLGKYKDHRRPLPCLALTTDAATLTCVTNDFSFDDVFARPLMALGREGDVLIAISTSGNSRNIHTVIEAAKQQRMPIIGLTGQTGGGMLNLCTVLLRVGSSETARIQEGHITLLHAWCEIIDRVMTSPQP